MARLQRMREDWHFGRWIVVAGVAVGVLTAVQQAVVDVKLYTCAWHAVVLATAVMVVLGIGERFWEHTKLRGAGVGPDGANVTFEGEIAESVETLNSRLDDHIKDINQRLYDVEKALFKDEGSTGE